MHQAGEPEVVRAEADLNDFLRAIDVVCAEPESVSKEAVLVMLWKAGQIIGRQMVLSELEVEATLALERAQPKGHA